jgi:ABC-type multidrug transport system ATPase subunit
MIVHAHDLRKAYGRTDALRGLSFSVPDGSESDTSRTACA